MRLTLTVLSAALLAAAAPKPEQCVTTIGLPGGCCPPDKARTSTSFIDCKGCSITSVTTGIRCMMICPTPRPIAPGLTTVTSCSPSRYATPTPVTTPPSPEPIVSGSVAIGPGFVACTKTITEHKTARCTYTKAAHTTTYSSDCSCCELLTATIEPRYTIRCQNPVTTVFNDDRTKTETVCATSTSCSIYW